MPMPRRDPYDRHTCHGYTQYPGYTYHRYTLTACSPRQGAALPRDRIALVPCGDHRGAHLDQHPAAAARGGQGHPRARTAAPPGMLAMAPPTMAPLTMALPTMALPIMALFLLWLSSYYGPPLTMAPFITMAPVITMALLTSPGRAQGVLVREAAAVGRRARGLRAEDDRGPAQLHLDARPHAMPGGALHY